MDQIKLHRLANRFRTHNDHNAFRELYSCFHKRVWFLIHAQNIPEIHADDVFQEVSIGLARYLVKQPKTPDNLKALVYSITRNKITDYFRRRKEQASFNELEETISDKRRCPARIMESRDEFHKLMAGCGLSSSQRETLVLHYLMGYTLNEIAELTLVSRDTAKSRIYYGKKALTAYLQRERERV
ncbi:MAG: sigma-70 family RNA polymerase sigma factor [Acidobacteriota bacterium]|nr:sigma-70 family RNA polymerase sigma factor [Acidobacteriota bacterium]